MRQALTERPKRALIQIAAFFLFALAAPNLSADALDPEAGLEEKKLATEIEWNPRSQGGFVLSLAADGEGRLWAGTEDRGLIRYNPAATDPKAVTTRWPQFTTSDGIGDDSAYSLCVDRIGRVWAGHLNKGVSVYNGQEWRNYGVAEGPLGERVFDIAVCPTDGDVWLATNAGLTRYSLQGDNWSYYTRANGLPSDQTSSLAFGATGDLYVGTQSDGIALASAEDNYKSWRAVKGPEAMPLTASGEGLPGSQVNDVLVAKNGTAYAATSSGLALSRDGGKTWSFTRGEDWERRVLGLRGLEQPAPSTVTGDLLLEEYLTCLAEDHAGVLWIGYRRQGYEARDGATNKRLFSSRETSRAKGRSDYVRAILPRKGRAPLIGKYGLELEGVIAADRFFMPAKAGDNETEPPGRNALAETGQAGLLPVRGLITALPSPAPVPPPSALEAMLKRAQNLQQAPAPGTGVYLGADWRTGGDWPGSYGRQYAVLCATRTLTESEAAAVPAAPADAPLRHYYINRPNQAGIKGVTALPLDHVVNQEVGYRVEGDLGPHYGTDKALMHVINALESKNKRVLFNPALGLRRDAYWDDYGAEYPQDTDGPDLLLTIQVPEGAHRVSLYFLNSNLIGGGTTPRYRDYLVELRSFRESVLEAAMIPALASARVRDFGGGVYQQFSVSGPDKFYVRVAKNGSPHTILQGVFLDRLGAQPNDASAPVAGEDSPEVKTARSLWVALDGAMGREGSAALQRPGRVMAFRAVAGVAASGKAGSEEAKTLLSQWRRTLGLWNEQERGEFNESAKKTG